MGREFLVVEREAIRLLAETAMIDINHHAPPRPAKQTRQILEDPEATDNDRLRAPYDLMKEANIAAGGILPMCQDTGNTSNRDGARRGASLFH